MSTKTDFYIGRDRDTTAWIGSLEWNCEPRNLLRFPPGRFALTATDESTYRTAVTDLLVAWETERIGTAYPYRSGWPWPWPTSHVSDWIITFDPGDNGVYATIGGGVRWERINPQHPREPDTDGIGPTDFEHWLRVPAAPPSVPLPTMPTDRHR
ncbi:hypothetical protein [Saccharothrix obliqua]|uniref:hypothetical protein n=1 Tax=Saccharothrix obliqua TaxID=2861747 RepID=UPI001C5F1A61|nr:hypothetical protein [Saccharothrix obliqua]MBW4717354.1 hypothetical protein [Saccharothrix obliqua]